jgi:hypothetical protein
MNLVISTVGDNSKHPTWLDKNNNFDLVLLYYGSNVEIAKSYLIHTPHVYSAKGFKWWLIKSFIDSNIELISKYDYIWFPDDDIEIHPDDINKLFGVADKFKLQLCQPSLTGYVSHRITMPQQGNLLRYTNFVEVMAPLMNLETVLKVKDTFDSNYSSWGLDNVWPYMLGYPTDKIAIIDSIVMNHSKPVGNPELYSKIPHSLDIDTKMVYDKFAPDVLFDQREYTIIKL